MAVFLAKQLCVARQGRTLLQGVNLKVQPGELHVLLGPNGAGKSTVIRALAGEWQASQGELLLDGQALSALSPLQQARRRAVLPQQDSLSFGLSVRELIRLGRYAARDQKPTTTNVIVEAVIAATQIGALADRRYPSLSGGEQRRAQLARVLAQVWDVPEGVLLLDEPTHSLDPAHQHAVLTLLRALADRGHAILASLHDLNLASAYAQQISLMRDGLLIVSGTPRQVLDEAQLQAVYGDSLQFAAVEHEGRRLWLTRRV